MSERKIVALSELYPASEIKLGSELYYVSWVSIWLHTVISFLWTVCPCTEC